MLMITKFSDLLVTRPLLKGFGKDSDLNGNGMRVFVCCIQHIIVVFVGKGILRR
jgi:hypothetical protein